MTFSFKYGDADLTTRTANQEYRALIRNVIQGGHIACPRGTKTFELNNAHTLISLSHPKMTIPERVIGEKFRAAEAWWILTGRNDVASIAPYSKQIAKFSDDGVYFAGAYGPKVVDQLSYAVGCLHKDIDSRQAIISIWRENLRVTKDVPCTLNMQFLVRQGALHCIVNMRSSDLWLGWPYDVFNFSMIARRVREMLNFDVRPGFLCINHGSLHLYDHDVEFAKAVADADVPEDDGYFPWIIEGGVIHRLEYLKDAPRD